MERIKQNRKDEYKKLKKQTSKNRIDEIIQNLVKQ